MKIIIILNIEIILIPNVNAGTKLCYVPRVHSTHYNGNYNTHVYKICEKESFASYFVVFNEEDEGNLDNMVVTMVKTDQNTLQSNKQRTKQFDNKHDNQQCQQQESCWI
jgi:hypothetical protein